MASRDRFLSITKIALVLRESNIANVVKPRRARSIKKITFPTMRSILESFRVENTTDWLRCELIRIDATVKNERRDGCVSRTRKGCLTWPPYPLEYHARLFTVARETPVHAPASTRGYSRVSIRDALSTQPWTRRPRVCWPMRCLWTN